ncbi:MAG: tRNA (adenosine(37)-N6)-threonylcarbamoyltransferase complex transferase subunit TsaD [Candidatus Pacebacteria bacterium]|nr:tRNA (adenosine(37)-N6)-threonylcarbamoyltransferase complex transferase subunit TsaD [Candidatus Paceibacterota bacterium]
MKILAIETSCDDTSIAVIEARSKKGADFNILSDLVSSQIEIHKEWGGVYPTLAKREHQRNLTYVLKKALKESSLLKIKKASKVKGSKLKAINSILKREPELLKKLIPFFEKYEKPDIDLISVTIGPGLEPCLWVGINFAKALSYLFNIPVVGVNHIESHILVNLLNNKCLFPAVCLVVSGGHTQLILMKGIGKYKIIGETKDDAAGECFDKAAKILGLGYPGGPVISKNAEGNTTSEIKLPRPMIYSKDYDFSFSGLKTAVLYSWQEIKTSRRKKILKQMCYEIQEAIVDVLIKKTIKAAYDYKAKTIILGGGVSANERLRKQLKEKVRGEFQLLIPKKNLSTDNAVMAGISGFYQRSKKTPWRKLKAKANLRI